MLKERHDRPTGDNQAAAIFVNGDGGNQFSLFFFSAGTRMIKNY